MFKVGDEVTVIRNYLITQMGDVGTIVSVEGLLFRVRFHTMQLDAFRGCEFAFMDEEIKYADGKSFTAIERKIKRMYERQSYFSRYRSITS